MLITSVAIFSALGLAVWLLGWFTGYYEIAVIGAVIVFGVGGGVAADGLDHETGEIEVEGENGTVTTETQYSSVDLGTSLPFGTLLMFAGAAMLLRSLDDLGGYA